MNPDVTESILADLKRRRIPVEVKRAVEILLDKKAEDITVLKLREGGEMTDFLLLACGNSGRQNRAMADALVKQLGKLCHLHPFGMEGAEKGDWILVDYIDLVVHLFLPEVRKRYALEKLWMDARRYDFPSRD
jgi:ribosome-associated protein